jgi:carbonic anhydrase/acetyltransferase-like protein (isoleucine patch superfamily)
MRLKGIFLITLLFPGAVLLAPAQVTYTDNFTTPLNYLTNGVAGTMWDGLYLGAGEFAGATSVGAAAGSVSVVDASISSNNVLTIASLQTDWENTADDGVLFYKVVTGDFDMSVHVIGPIDTGSYNLPGLMVRGFGAGGAPSPNAAENSLVLGRFDEFSIANMSKNNVNGVKSDTGLGTYPNANFWLRIERVGNVFNLYEKALEADPWSLVGSVTRAEFSGARLQVGIEHADFGGGATRTARYEKFSLTVSNQTAGLPPGPAGGLIFTSISNRSATISWLAGSGSSGSLVAVWTNNPVVKQAPANSFVYNGNAGYGFGDALPAAGYFVVYSGTNTNVTVTNLVAGTAYNVAVFACSGSGNATIYTNSPATGSFTTAGATVTSSNIVVDPIGPVLTNYTSLGEWDADGNFDGWATGQITDAGVSNGVVSGMAGGNAPQLTRLNFAGGPDLDLGFNDQLEIRLQVPTNFTGNIQIYYGTTNTPGSSGSRVITIPNAIIPTDGAFHVYRMDVGLEILWRGTLRDLLIYPLGSAATVGQAFAVDYVRIGDLAGEVYWPRYTTSNPALGQLNELGRAVIEMQSKHFRFLWDTTVASNSFWRANMPHGTLRNLEEVWQLYVKRLGYREPSESWVVANRDGKKYKVNVSTWHSGYWAGNEVPGSVAAGRLNITPDGLRVDPPTWVIPHELGHVFQFHQKDGGQTMDGAQSEAHANYVRERWIYFYGPVLPGWTDQQSNLDSFFSATAHFYHSHGRHYYLHWPIFLYLDENPDGLPDLGEGFVVKLWQQTLSGEYLYNTIARLAPHNNIKDIVGQYARHNVAWDYSHRTQLTTAANTGDADFLQRWVIAELRQRPDDPSWWQVPPEMAPMQGAYKIHQLIPQGSGAGRVVSVNFHGLPIASRGADWRVSFVVVSDSGAVRYSGMWNAGTNSVTLAANENTVYLVAAGTPNSFLFGAFDDTVYPYQLSNPASPGSPISQQRTRFPYELQISGATPKESNNGGTSGLVQHVNGLGWKSTSATVDSTAYIGPNARVLGSAIVRNNARIEDYAVVKDNAQVLNNAVVSGHAVVRNSAIVMNSAKVRDYGMIIDNSIVADFARVLQHGELTAGSTASNWATVKGCVSTWEDNSVMPNQRAGNDAVLDGDFSTARTVTNGFQFGFLPYDPGPQAWISARTAPRRLYADYEFTAAHDSLMKDFYGVTDGYLQGGPVWVSSDGKRAGFLTFNGSNQYVILDRSLPDLQEISVTAWVKWAGGTSNQPVWFFGAATNKCMFFTPDDGTGHVKFVIRTNSSDQMLVAPAALVTGVWTHVAVTLSNGATGRLYVNGVLQQQGAISITPDQLNAPDGNTNLPQNYLARGADSSKPFFNGAVDSFRVYTGALTNGEIAAMQSANLAPTLNPVSNQTVNAGVVLSITNTATDPDLPWQTLAFSLLSPPPGAVINTNSGVITWRPTVAQANNTNQFRVKVADNGTPSLSATQSFFVTVRPLAAPSLSGAAISNGQFVVRISGDFGPDYVIESSTNLLDWSTIFTTNSPVLPFDWTDSGSSQWPANFYRVRLQP